MGKRLQRKRMKCQVDSKLRYRHRSSFATDFIAPCCEDQDATFQKKCFSKVAGAEAN